MPNAFRKILTLAALLSLPVYAADWVLVAKDDLRRIELDRSTVMASDGGSKVAWGRIVLGDSQAAKAGYKTIRVLNRYDCKTRAFSVVKRIYLADDERTLREEPGDSAMNTAIRPGTVDERFYTVVCGAADALAAGGKADTGEKGERLQDKVASSRLAATGGNRTNAPNGMPRNVQGITPQELMALARKSRGKSQRGAQAGAGENR